MSKKWPYRICIQKSSLGVSRREYCRILQEYSQKEILKREILKILKRPQRKVCMRLYVEQRMKCMNIIMIVKRIHWTFEEEIIVWENIELLGYCGVFCCYFEVFLLFLAMLNLSSLTRIRTCVLCSRSTESKPLNLQGIPRAILLIICEIMGRRM